MMLQVSMAGDMATWLVARSHMHPAFSDLPVMYGMRMGGHDDPTTRNTPGRFEHLILQLQTAAYDQAKRVIRQRKAAIEKLAQELIGDPQETVEGQRIVEVIETMPVAEPELSPTTGVWSEKQQPAADTEVGRRTTSLHGFFSVLSILDICYLFMQHRRFCACCPPAFVAACNSSVFAALETCC